MNDKNVVVVAGSHLNSVIETSKKREKIIYSPKNADSSVKIPKFNKGLKK